MAQADTIEHKIAAALEADNGDPDAPTAVRVLFDVFAWTTPAPKGSKAKVLHHHATRGDVVTVPRAAAIRGAVLGACELTDLDPAAGPAPTSGAAEDLGALDDPAALAKVSAEEILAYITQHGAESDEAAQVAALEAERGEQARTSILKAAGYTADEVAAVKAG